MPEPRIAGTDRIRFVCPVTAGVRRRAARVTRTRTAADQLLTLAGSDALIRARPIVNFREAGDDGLLTRALTRGRSGQHADTPANRWSRVRFVPPNYEARLIRIIAHKT